MNDVNKKARPRLPPVSDLEGDIVDVEDLADDLIKFYDYKSSFSRYSMFMA